MKERAGIKDLRKEVKPFLLAVFIVGPFFAFICSVAVSVAYTLFYCFTAVLIEPRMFGALTAFFCVLLSYLTLRRYNKVVAIIYCTSGTLIFGLIPTVVMLPIDAVNPLSLLTGILGYFVGLSLLNFNIGVHRVEAFVNHVYSFFGDPKKSVMNWKNEPKGISKEIAMFLLAIFIVGPFFGFLCGFAMPAVYLFAVHFNKHVQLAILYPLSAVPCVALSYPVLRRYKPRIAIIYCMLGTLAFSFFIVFLFSRISPYDIFMYDSGLYPNSGTTVLHSWLLGLFGYWVGVILLKSNVGVRPVEAFYNHMADFFSGQTQEQTTG